VRVRVFIGEPPRRIDAIEHIIGDVEGEVEAAAIMLDVTPQGEIFGIGRLCELRNPVSDSREPGGVIPLGGDICPSRTGVAPR
jgi:hypothetical protein